MVLTYEDNFDFSSLVKAAGAMTQGATKIAKDEVEKTEKDKATWKSTLKNPEKTFGYLERLGGLASGLFGKKRPQEEQQGFSRQYAQQPTFQIDPMAATATTPMPQNPKPPVPTAVWVALGAILLLSLGFFIYKMASD